MRTITLKEPGQFFRSETASPSSLEPGEALVRISRIGICGTDLHAFQGNQPFFSYPRILGHELGVEVLEAPANERGIRAGDRCAVEPYLHCKECVPCRLGRMNCCEKLQVLGVHVDGGMRETLRVPVEKLHKSNQLEFDQLALVETLGIGCHAVQRAALQKDEPVLVIGAGPIGLSIVQFAKVAGANVVLLEASPSRMAFCQEQFHVEHAIDVRDEPLEKIRSVLGGEMPRAVFDATGNPKSMMSSFDYVSSAGRLILVGLYLGEVTFSDPEFHRRELTILSSRNALPDDFVRIIRLMEEGKVDTRPWITHRATYDTLIEEFPGWLQPDAGVVKAILEF